MFRADLQAVEKLRCCGIFGPVDLHLAASMCRLAGSDDEALALAAALASRATGLGHVCLDLSQDPGSLFPQDAPRLPDLAGLAPRVPGLPGVGAPGDFAPLILDGPRLYLCRYHAYERDLAEGLTRLAGETRDDLDEARLGRILARLFPDGDDPDMQMVAAYASARSGLTVITGGPGTGKTTTAARIVAMLMEFHSLPGAAIALAAPTGKAAARLSESIRGQIEGLDCPPEFKSQFPTRALTLHRLLGTRVESPHCRYDRDTPLPFAAVVVDEASMVDLPLMAKLVRALAPGTRMILLGDRDQLSSVEAGAVMADICAGASPVCFSKSMLAGMAAAGVRASGLSPLDGDMGPLADCVISLTRTWRFGPHSGIAALSRAVRDGDASGASQVLGQDFADLSWQEVGPLGTALVPVIAHAGGVLDAATPEAAFAALKDFQLLSPLRRGPYGVVALNRFIADGLRERGKVPGRRAWYPGRPVMVTQNNPVLSLFNGDVGVTRIGDEGNLEVFFEREAGLRKIAVSRLEQVEDVYAMTVHKSQGSEFTTVFLLLPDRDSPVLTRELLYTALTRAKKRVVVCGGKDVFAAALKRKTKRHSGLAGRLWKTTNA